MEQSGKYIVICLLSEISEWIVIVFLTLIACRNPSWPQQISAFSQILSAPLTFSCCLIFLAAKYDYCCLLFFNEWCAYFFVHFNKQSHSYNGFKIDYLLLIRVFVKVCYSANYFFTDRITKVRSPYSYKIVFLQHNLSMNISKCQQWKHWRCTINNDLRWFFSK